MQLHEKLKKKNNPLCKLCVPIVGPQQSDILKQIALAEEKADMLEYRIDLWDQYDDKIFQVESKLPKIFTLRKAFQGGGFQGSHSEWVDRLSSLLKFLPDFIDIEADISLEEIKKLQKQFPKTQWIVSWHHYDTTPENLDELFLKLKLLPANYYKIATYAQRTSDALRMLNFVKRINFQNSILCGLCMGELGQITRLLAPIVGAPWTYASLESKVKSAPGQIPIKEMLDVYRFDTLNKDSLIYGLIGNPLDKSPSHLSHNQVFKKFQINAIYLKFKLEENELTKFFSLIKQLNFKGCSVTMPYKEAVMAFLKQSNNELTKVGACNTIKFDNDHMLIGRNTDGIGAIAALGIEDFSGLKVIIIGAGGTAKAIAHEIFKRNGKITILNRTIGKAKHLADKVKAKYGALEDFDLFQKEGCDILIHTTPFDVCTGIDYQLSKNTLVFDVVNRIDTEIINAAKKNGCKTIGGEELFVKQAIEQFRWWFNDEFDSTMIEQTIKKNLK